MEFGILGPLVVSKDGREVPIGAAKQRALLALLLLRRGELVPTETLVHELWGERPPATALKVVQVYVSQLRKVLGVGLVETRPAGYVLRFEPDMLDAARFEGLLGRGRGLLADGDARAAGDVLREGLGLWRGSPLAEFRYEDFARDEIGRLEGLRLVALELRLEADLALGRNAEVVPELEALVREHPRRESLRELLMLALYRAGRQADALEAYQHARAVLVEELGLDPSESLQHLETAILRHDPTLDLPGPAQAPPAAGPPPPMTTISGPRTAGRGQAAVRAGRRRLVVVLACGAIATTAAVTASILLLGRGGTGSAPAKLSANAVGIYHPDNGRLTLSGQIPVGAAPSAIAAGDGSIWVANVDADSVSKIDPAKQVTIDTIPVGNGPDGIAVGGGFVWVTNGLDGTVSKIDPQTDTVVQTIQVGNGPAGVAVDAHYVWVANSDDGTVTQIDRRTGKRLNAIPVGQSADGIAVGYGSVWVTSMSTGSVTRIDARSGSKVPVQSGNGADAVTVTAHAVWIANSLDGTVTRVDPATNAVRATIPVGDGPDGIATVGGAVWVSNELAGTLSRIDPVRNVVVQTIKTGNQPDGIVPDSGALYVAAGASNDGHHGGTLTVLTQTGDLVHVDPALAYSLQEGQVVTLTNDGLTGLRRVGGIAGTHLVPDLAVSLPAPTDGGLSYSFQLRPGIRYSTGALVRPQDFRWAIERSLELSDDGAYYAPYYANIIGARRCLVAPKRPCDLSQGIVADTATNTVTFHLTSPDPDFLYKLALPSAYAVPVGTPLHPGGFLPATGPYEIASFDPKHAIRLDPQPEVSRMVAGSPAERLPEHHRPAPQRLGGRARLRGRARLGRSGVGSPPAVTGGACLPADAACEPAQDQPVEPDRLPRPQHTTCALQRRTCASSVELRRQPRASEGHHRRRGSRQGHLPSPAPGRRRVPALLPLHGRRRTERERSLDRPDLERARQLVRASGTAGQAVTVWIQTGIGFGAAAGRYIVSVLDNLGYKARFQLAADPFNEEDKLRLQAGFNAWYPDFPTPAGFFNATLTCGAYNPINSESSNLAEFCDPTIDHEIAHAQSLQTNDPEAAPQLWAKIDRDITNQAPWVSFANGVVLEVASARVGNYQYNPQWGTLLDQLWIR